MEWLSQHSSEDLARALSASEPISYRTNGNRSIPADQWLARIEPVAQRVGITRLADISALAAVDFPVFQSARPNLWTHHSLGQNSGSQGKGPTPTQARVSCLMEAIEAYCAEPRCAQLVRGSYAYLRGQHRIAPPSSLFRRYGCTAAAPDEPLMWTPALHLGNRRSCLVPAEAVFFYFDAQTYGTRSVFPMGTSGLASGATHLEAVVHGLYELIERMYAGYVEQGLADTHCVWESDVRDPRIERLIASYRDYELQLHTALLPGVRNLPYFATIFAGDHPGDQFVGFGCAGDVDTALMRAVSEAMQAYATIISGSREDIGQQSSVARVAEDQLIDHLADERDLQLDQYRGRVEEREFATLEEELDFLLRWLGELGYHNVYAANLTRHGVDIPVVRVLVHGLPTQRSTQGAAHRGASAVDVARRRFSVDRSALRSGGSPGRSSTSPDSAAHCHDSGAS